MTAIAMMLDRQTPGNAPLAPQAPKGVFAKLVEDQAKPDPAILALLQAIPPREMPSGGIPEVIATEVSVVMDLPVEPALDLELGPAGAPLTPLEQAVVHDLITIPQRPMLPELAPMPRLVRATADIEPIDPKSEISDGIPVVIERAPRPSRKTTDPGVDITALQLQLVPQPMRELMHARTLLAIPTSFVEQATRPVAVPTVHIPVLDDVKTTAIAIPQAALLTPLEQAVQSLISESTDREEPIPSTADAPLPALPFADAPRLALDPHKAVAPVIGPREIIAQPENHNPSHVHLVIDDGMERVVVTVAVRGSDVNVAMRGSDDATTAALARNAGSLDHAMRGRGLDLQSFVSDQRDERREAPRERQEARRDRRAQELFSIEELA
jgi:hypothetical protein